MGKYRVIITSNFSHGREYETDSKSAMAAAKLYGRCEGGETVSVTTKHGRIISQVFCTPEGGEYYRAFVGPGEYIDG